MRANTVNVLTKMIRCTRKYPTFLRARKESPILLETKVDFDEVSTGEELHNHSRGDNGTDTQFHQRSAVRGQNDTHPVERIGRV